MTFKTTLFTISALLLAAQTAQAEDWYLSAYGGINIQSSSSNSGETGAFTTGNLGDGTTLDVASGTAYGWETDFDNGTVFGAEIGKTYEGFRFGLEANYSKADVDTHTNVTLGGGAIGTLDAAAIAGSPTALGVTIGDVVADGQGDITQLGVFANAYYDFDLDTSITPYVGVGIGFVDVDVEYSPSAISVIDDGQTKFAYQARVGASFDVSDKVGIFAEYTYRQSDDIETENSLFPGTLDIENKQSLVTAGVRFHF